MKTGRESLLKQTRRMKYLLENKAPTNFYDCHRMAAFVNDEPILDLYRGFEKPKVATHFLQCSKEYLAEIRKLPEAQTFNMGGMEVEVQVMGSVFPYEKTWAACDIKTKLEHQIPSGEFVHAVMGPKNNWFEPLSLMSPEPERKPPYLAHIERSLMSDYFLKPHLTR